MVDLDDINIFEKYDSGTFALISGMFMIATATYIIYFVSPKAIDNTSVFYYAMISLVLTVFTPVLFYMSTLVDFSEIIGKFLSGITLAVFGTLIYHVSQEMDIGTWFYPIPRILLTGIFGFITSFLFIRGVAVQKIEENEEWIEMEEEEEFEEDILEEEIEKNDKFPEEEDEPW